MLTVGCVDVSTDKYAETRVPLTSIGRYKRQGVWGVTSRLHRGPAESTKVGIANCQWRQY